MKLSIIDQPGKRPLPIQISKVTQPFWDGLKNGCFQTSKCSDCEKIMFPPKAVCPVCQSRDLHWQRLSGSGVLYSFTTIHAAPPMFSSQAPLRVAIIDLDEGVRIITRLLNGEHDLALNSAIELVVTRYEDGCLFAARQRPE